MNPCLSRTLARTLSTKADPFNAFISIAPNVSSSASAAAASKPKLTHSLKDNFVAGLSTAGARILSNFELPYTATASFLLEPHSTLIGKNNMDEFGMGSSNTNSYFGAAINPLHMDPHITGGSSGGSAAAVAGGLVDFSLGTDTGGSVRLPASYCGIYGFKPSYGRVSRWGVVAYAQTLDTVGILARDLAVVALVYGVLDRHDPKDPTSLSPEVRQLIASSRSSQHPKQQLTFGFPEEFLVDELSASHRASWLGVLSRLQDLGHTVVSVSIPSIKKLLLAYYTIATAEAASNLSRYDGVRYGFSEESPSLASAPQIVTKNRSNGFGPEVQKRILLGNYTLSADSGNHYRRATDARKQLVDEFNAVFRLDNHLTGGKGNPDGCDILIAPTSIGSTPTIEEFYERDSENFLNSYVNDLLTVPASLAGIPSISVPWSHGEETCGIQFMAQFGDDEALLEVVKDIVQHKGEDKKD